MRAPVAVGALLALGAEFRFWTAMWIVVVVVAVGAAAVVGLQAARRWRQYGADTTKRLGRLDSLIVEHPPANAEASLRSDRAEPAPGGDEIGLAERVAAIIDDSEPRRSSRGPGPPGSDSEGGVALGRRIASARRPIPPRIHRTAADSPAPARSGTVIGSSYEPVEVIDESALLDLTNDEVAMLFNRYEHLARVDWGTLSGDERILDDEVRLDLTPGETMPFVDTTRRTSDGFWVYLRSGHIVCKLAGSDVWTPADGRERESTRPVVAVTLVQDEEPTELYFSFAPDPGNERPRSPSVSTPAGGDAPPTA